MYAQRLELTCEPRALRERLLRLSKRCPSKGMGKSRVKGEKSSAWGYHSAGDGSWLKAHSTSAGRAKCNTHYAPGGSPETASIWKLCPACIAIRTLPLALEAKSKEELMDLLGQEPGAGAGRRAGQGRRAAKAHQRQGGAITCCLLPGRRRRVAVGGRRPYAARRPPAAGAGTHAAGELTKLLNR